MIPRMLKKGDTIGVIATSDPIDKDCIEEIKEATRNMEDIGVNIKFAKHAYQNPTGYGETARHKAEDINEMFADKSIDGIFCAMRWI